MRVDKLIFEKGLVKSRAAAKRLIEDGLVLADGVTVKKPSLDISDNAVIVLISGKDRYVSRGGLKLEGALDAFGISPEGLDCVDIGASTGGFTDCLLQRGAVAVRAVDVGHGQLDEGLGSDPRVTSYEGMNARYITPEDIGGMSELVVSDVSFISITLIMPAIRGILKGDGRFICLIKPQFEAGRAALNKNGIVKDRNIHIEVIKKVLAVGRTVGLYCFGLVKSPILGGDGNTEYLAAFDNIGGFDETALRNVVYGND